MMTTELLFIFLNYRNIGEFFVSLLTFKGDHPGGSRTGSSNCPFKMVLESLIKFSHLFLFQRLSEVFRFSKV